MPRASEYPCAPAIALVTCSRTASGVNSPNGAGFPMLSLMISWPWASSSRARRSTGPRMSYRTSASRVACVTTCAPPPSRGEYSLGMLPARCRPAYVNITRLGALGVGGEVAGQAYDPVAAGGYFRVVGCQDDRAAVGGDREHAGQYELAGDGVLLGRRLVGDQQFGRGRQGPGYRHALLL